MPDVLVLGGVAGEELDGDEAVAMSARARALVDDGLNSKASAHALVDVFDAVLQR